jgi:hypothetical protein
MSDQTASLLLAAANKGRKVLVGSSGSVLVDTASAIDAIKHLLEAIRAHHDTKYGADPAAGAAVISPVDQTLYAAAGLSFKTLQPDQGFDPARHRQLSGAAILHSKADDAL